MPKRISRRKLDTVQNARRVVLESVGEVEEAETEPTSLALISQVMAEMGRKGGRIGGKRRLETMSSRRRIQIARNAAKTRWAKKKRRIA
jgi:hypothetical protein